MIGVQRFPTTSHAEQMVTSASAATGVDPARAATWAYLRAMEEILWAVTDHEDDDLRLHLAVATALAETPASPET